MRPVFWLASAIALAALSACGDAQSAPAAPPPPAVTVAIPLEARVSDWDTFAGRFEAAQRVEVRARAGGFVQNVHFTDGQRVEKGQLLFTLDARPAQAALAAAQADAARARNAMDRADLLIKEQAISREEFDQRKAALEIANAAVRARQLDVEFTRVTAPIAGVASDRRVDPGNVIAGGTSMGDVLTTIVSADPIHFSFEASEAQLLRYQRQAESSEGRVEIQLQDEPDYRWNGQVVFLDNVVDGSSGAVRMRAAVPNAEGFLKPGMFGRARVQSSAVYDGLLVPDTAIMAQGGEMAVYVVGADGVVAMRTVKLGPVIDGMRVIADGLAANDQVIVNGMQRARPGAVVQAQATQLTRTAALDAAITAQE